MIGGYVRLSRDDDRQNYISIENQKLIIEQYAASQNLTVDKWYEDDGISGYRFDRPAFCEMMKDLDKGLDTVIVKDFSRLGRHNAKVLLLLDEFQEREKHLIIIDDNYDSHHPDDEVIGIKTWYNERYVKDTSKKIRKALHARQKEGTLFINVPYGYIRDKEANNQILAVPDEAIQIKQIFSMYLNGKGYRSIAHALNNARIPTPSMANHRRELSSGRLCKRPIANAWSEYMVKNILSNDFYTGSYRLHKRSRTTVHGRDKRVPKDQQFLFEHHHEAIIDRDLFQQVQTIREHRNLRNHNFCKVCEKTAAEETAGDLSFHFQGYLYCKDCKKLLTPVKRQTKAGIRQYYICSAYNSKGCSGCKKSHLIEEMCLRQIVDCYLSFCLIHLKEIVKTWEWNILAAEKSVCSQTISSTVTELQSAVQAETLQLKRLIGQKLKDLADVPENSSMIIEVYEELQREQLNRIQQLNTTLSEAKEKTCWMTGGKSKPLCNISAGTGKEVLSPIAALEKIAEQHLISWEDIGIFIKKIIVDEHGMPEIQLNYGVFSYLKPRKPEIAASSIEPALSSFEKELNTEEHHIIRNILELMQQDYRGFLSARYISEQLNQRGIQKSPKAVLPYIRLIIAMGILCETGNSRKPYLITGSQEEICKLMNQFSC